MTSLLIYDLDPDLHARLKTRADERGRSVEQEAQELLRRGLGTNTTGPAQNLAELARTLFEPLGWIDLEPLPRESVRELPDFLSEDYGPPDE